MTDQTPDIDPTRVWYAVADMLPPLGVRILLRWQGDRPPFEAARVKDPANNRRHRWLTHDEGRAVLLPTRAPPPDPRRPWAGWHTLAEDGPRLWRPLQPALWKLPLPQPALVEAAEPPVLSLHAEGQSFTATEAAIFEDGAGPPPEPAEPQQWWRHWWLVTYSAPGGISDVETEGRLMRALATERWIMVERPRVALNCTTIERRSAEKVGLDPDTEPPPDRGDEPTGRDRDDYLVAMAWLHGMPAGTVELLRLRSLQQPVSWRRLAKAWSTDPGTMRARYRRAILAAMAVANGQTAQARARA